MFLVFLSYDCYLSHQPLVHWMRSYIFVTSQQSWTERERFYNLIFDMMTYLDILLIHPPLNSNSDFWQYPVVWPEWGQQRQEPPMLL